MVDAESADRAFEEGRAMALDDAVTLAMDEGRAASAAV
jgi:hypothetical protein